MFSDYIRSVITVALCAFLYTIFGNTVCKDSASTKALRLLTNLCVFTVVLLPLISAFKSIDTDSFKIKSQQYEQVLSFDFNELTENETAKKLKEQIYEKTGISVLDLSIDILCEDDVVSINKVETYVRTIQEKDAVLTALCDLLGDKTELDVKVDEIEDN